MSKLSRFWNESPELCCGLALFAVLIAHGASIGLTDDEAYYWVLAQKPDLGYAYHPPMIAWLIAASQALFGWILGSNSELVVRLPAALCSAGVLTLALKWLREVGVPRERLGGAALVLLSLAGLFSLSWMMVPDLPLFVGWMISVILTWRICSREASRAEYLALAGATALSVLSKYSGVLVALSSLICVWCWAPRERRWKSFFALLAGGVAAAIPILIWNATHEWTSILYQIRDRHEGGGGLSLVRWARFWAIELFAAGPFLILWGLGSLPRAVRKETGSPVLRVDRFLWVFAAPAVLVFCLQPLLADFKPHWALVAWWPLMLLMAWSFGLRSNPWARWQMRYGLTLGALVLVSCHLPLGNYAIYAAGSEKPDPRLDVTNDLYGWSKLEPFLRTLPGNEDLSMPVVGSRYQTAAQAYFALGSKAAVTMLPRDLKARDEWPNLEVAKSPGPEWSELTKSVLFVADNRYDAPPEFPNSDCKTVGRVEAKRAGHPAKWIDVWRCEPRR